MKGDDDVLALLAEMCADWGYHGLAVKLREESEGERRDATMLIERILFLEGTPDLGRLHAIATGTTVKALFERDLAMEYTAIAAYEAGIVTSRERGDNATEDLLTKILVSEQEDTHWLEAQLELMRQIGEQNYLAQQLRG
jgi:bacterioferritin